MAEPSFIPLPGYRAYPEAEMLHRATELRRELERRRTVRHFSDRPVQREVIAEALLAAGTAPSGAHRQPWRFVVVSDPALKLVIRREAEEAERHFYSHAPAEWLAALTPLGTDANKPYLQSAPYLIAIFVERFQHTTDGRRTPNYYAMESVGIATGLLLTTLHHAGLVTLTHTPSPMGFLGRLLGRPDSERAFCLLVVGHPSDAAMVPDLSRKRLEEIAIWR